MFDIKLCPIPVVERDNGRRDYILLNTEYFKESETIKKPYIGIYSSADAYPTGAGKALVTHFNTYEKALNLIAGGVVSSVVPERIVYNRDLASSFLKEGKRSIVQDDRPNRCEAFRYLFYKRRWFVSNSHSHWYDVKQVLEALNDVTQVLKPLNVVDFVGECETDELFNSLPECDELINLHDSLTPERNSILRQGNVKIPTGLELKRKEE